MHKRQIIGLVSLGALGIASAVPAQTGKPVAKKPILRVGKDGLPSGHATPEGAACDLARAFIQHNPTLFKSACIKPFGGAQTQKEYRDFLQKTAQSIAADAKQAAPSPNGPKAIGIVFASRHLSKSGPASYGYATFDFKDVQFVDVGVFLQSGQRAMNRTMVIQASDGKWYVYPTPTAMPLLSAGLSQEANSTKELKDVYTLQ